MIGWPENGRHRAKFRKSPLRRFHAYRQTRGAGGNSAIMSHQTPSQPADVSIDRRTFVKTAGAAGVGLALAGCAAGGSTGKQPATQAAAGAAVKKDGPRRYAIVGLGSRSS